MQFRRYRPENGQLQWVRASVLTIHDASGNPTRLIGVIRDITEEKAAENARETLVAELDHRVKNVLASVQSLAAQSARKTTSLEAFLKTFAGRLEAMASAHTLLTATRWRGAEISNRAALNSLRKEIIGILLKMSNGRKARIFNAAFRGRRIHLRHEVLS